MAHLAKMGLWFAVVALGLALSVTPSQADLLNFDFSGDRTTITVASQPYTVTIGTITVSAYGFYIDTHGTVSTADDTWETTDLFRRGTSPTEQFDEGMGVCSPGDEAGCGGGFGGGDLNEIDSSGHFDILVFDLGPRATWELAGVTLDSLDTGDSDGAEGFQIWSGTVLPTDGMAFGGLGFMPEVFVVSGTALANTGVAIPGEGGVEFFIPINDKTDAPHQFLFVMPSGAGTNDFLVNLVVGVPEPGSLLLLGAGLIGLGVLVRRRDV